MYIPAAFHEQDLGKLHDFIERHSFGVLVSEVDGEPFATHLPLLLERQAGRFGTLVGHTAKANPQLLAAKDQTALVVFSGPHAYISPTWYAEENTVPTWNYVAVHATGRVQLVEEPVALLQIVADSVELYERNLPQPWPLDRSSAFIAKLLPQIVGFRMEIVTLEGKWKLNQNQPLARRERVVRALRARGDEPSQAMADLVEQAIEKQ